MQRKTQLDAMLGDSQRYEAKRQEVDAWLNRMETRMERMGTVGHTADVLEAQLREQKVSNSRLIYIKAGRNCQIRIKCYEINAHHSGMGAFSQHY